jgi:hypothetical protein
MPGPRHRDDHAIHLCLRRRHRRGRQLRGAGLGGRALRVQRQRYEFLAAGHPEPDLFQRCHLERSAVEAGKCQVGLSVVGHSCEQICIGASMMKHVNAGLAGEEKKVVISIKS